MKVLVAGADRPPEPAEGVLDVPLDQLPALRVGASHLHQFLGGFAVLRELLPRLSLQTMCAKFDADIHLF